MQHTAVKELYFLSSDILEWLFLSTAHTPYRDMNQVVRQLTNIVSLRDRVARYLNFYYPRVSYPCRRSTGIKKPSPWIGEAGDRVKREGPRTSLSNVRREVRPPTPSRKKWSKAEGSSNRRLRCTVSNSRFSGFDARR